MKTFIKRHRFLFALIIVLVIGVPVAIYFFTRPSTDSSFVEVKRGSIIEAVYGIGTVQATNTYELKVGVPSTIAALYVKEGDWVKKGQRLLLLDGLRQFDAPFDGIVTSLPYHRGEAVFPQVGILTLTNFKDRYLIVSLEQRGAMGAKRGQQVKLSFEYMRDENFEGRVESVYSDGDRFLVRIDAPDLPLTILPGMTADVSIIIRQHDNVILIPIAAIKLGKVEVRRGKSGKTQEISVETGIADGDTVQVTAGDLREGDYVLIHKG